MQIKKWRYSINHIVNPTFILTVKTCVAEIAPWKIKKETEWHYSINRYTSTYVNKYNKIVRYSYTIYNIISVIVWYETCAISYLCNQCISPLTLWVRIPLRRTVLNTLCDQVCRWLAAGRWFSPGTSVSSNNIKLNATI
jgi:hypothetical protein